MDDKLRYLLKCVSSFLSHFTFFFSTLFTTEPNPTQDYKNVWHFEKKHRIVELYEMNCENFVSFFSETRWISWRMIRLLIIHIICSQKNWRRRLSLFVGATKKIEKFVVFNIFNDLMCLFNPFEHLNIHSVSQSRTENSWKKWKLR